MGSLWRASPRKLAQTFAATLTGARSAASGIVANTEFFRNAGDITSGEAQTSDAVGNVTVDATVSSGQGSQTSDLACLPQGNAIIVSAQAQTSNAVASITVDATISSAQGQTSSVAANIPIAASIVVGQGSQTTTASGLVKVNATATTSQGSQSSNVVASQSSTSINAAVTTGQGGQTSAIVGLMNINATVTTSQGSQSSAGNLGPGNVRPSGIAGAFGTTTIYLATRYVAAGLGTAANSVLGTARVEYANRALTLTGLAPGSFGTTTATHFLRTVDQAGHSLQSLVVGTASISYRIRSVFPVTIVSPGTGFPRVSAQLDPIAPLGIPPWDDPLSQFGTSEWFINAQWVYPVAITGAIGDLVVFNQHSPVFPGSIRPIELGVPNVRNYIQNIVNFPQDALYGTGTPLIENKNRTIVPIHGHGALYGFTVIANNAVPLYPTGWDSFQYGRDLAIDYKDRSRTLVGFEAGAMGPGTIISKPPEIRPAGLASADYGNGSIVNLNRTLPPMVAIDSLAFGTSFVAFKIRNVVPVGFTNDTFAFNSIPNVANYTGYIAPLSFSSYHISDSNWQIHHTVFAPATILPKDYYAPNAVSVLNRNRPLLFNGLIQTEYGNHLIENKIKYVTPPGLVMTSYGHDDIGPRTKNIFQAPMASPPHVSDTHHVQRVGPELPANRIVSVPGTNVGLRGIPTVRFNMAFPPGISPGLFGGTVVTCSNLFVGIYDVDLDSLMGTPSLNHPQYVTPPSMPIHDTFDTSLQALMGKPRLDPSYILVGEPPKWVNPNEGYFNSTMPAFGTATSPPCVVTYKNRAIFPRHDFGGDTAMGEHMGSGATVDLRVRYLRAVAIKPGRFGSASLPFTQEVSMDDEHDGLAPYAPDYEGVDTRPDVAFVPPFTQNLNPTAFTGSVGRPGVDFFNRTRSPAGIFANRMGGVVNGLGDLLHRVHFPDPPDLYGAGDNAAFGTPFISFRIREIFPEGDDMLIFHADESSYRNRLHVTLIHRSGTVPGIAAGSMGQVSVTNSIRQLAPSPIVSYNVGTPFVSKVNTIAPIGLNPTIYGSGHVDLVVQNSIKVYSDDPSRVGTPRMTQTILPGGFLDETIPAPRFARNIITWSMPPVGFNGPVFTATTFCGDRAIAVPTMGDLAHVTEVSIA